MRASRKICQHINIDLQEEIRQNVGEYIIAIENRTLDIEKYMYTVL